MALKGWLLLVIFLLMQAGLLSASSCRPGAAGFAETGGCCSAVQGCCCESGDSVPACACPEDPAGNERPAPVTPAPSVGGRPLLPAVVWIEPHDWVRSLRAGGAPRFKVPAVRAGPGRAAAPLALTVRYCAFLI